jgi:hypothetical protein
MSEYKIDKSQFEDGPWQTEPDRVEWRHRGLPCLILRSHSGALCGYVGVPSGHPCHGKGCDEIADLEVHGGLTYSNTCNGHICHVPQPGESGDDVWWLGFDCAHAWDYWPKNAVFQRAHFARRPDEIYRDMPYVRAEVERLADQIADRA